MYCSTFMLHIKHSAAPSQLSLRHMSDFNITPPPSLLSGVKHREICRQLPPTLSLMKDSLPMNSSPAAPEKPTTLARSCSTQPSLNRPLSTRFSFGQMLFASEAAATHTYKLKFGMLAAPTSFRKLCSSLTLPSSSCWCQSW